MYCKTCGSLLVPRSPRCAYCGAGRGVGKEYCQSCGRRVADDADVCGICKASLVPRPDMPWTPAKEFTTAAPDADELCGNCGERLRNGAEKCPCCGFTLPGASMREGLTGSRKSKWVALLLCVFLGLFGLHNFYLGYEKKGTTQFLLTLSAPFALRVAPIFIVVWILVDLILILRNQLPDAQGRPLRR